MLRWWGIFTARLLLTYCAGTAFGISYAQSAQPQTSTPGNSGVEEVVVTALRRSQSLLTTPASVQAFTIRDIENANITRPKDFIGLTPNVSLVESNHAGESFIVIRGEAPARNAESSVAVVIDGVQQATANEFNQDLFDIQQIEVLKGPQGALYGRNSVGGAIIINTRQPTNDYEGWVTAGIANGPAEKVQASIGGPIVLDKLLFKLDASFRNTDGYRTNVNTGEHPDRQENQTGRALVTWRPTDDTKIDFRVGATDLDGGGIAFTPQLDEVLQPLFTNPRDAEYKCLQHVDSNNLCVPFVSNIRSYDRQNKDNESIRIDQQVGWGEVISTTSRSFIRDAYGAGQFPYAFGDVPAFGGKQTQWVYLDNDAISQELRFVSPNDLPVRFSVGAYGLHEQSDRKTNIREDDDGTLPSGQHPGFSGIDMSNSYRFDRTKNDVYSVFGNLDYDIIKDLTVTLAFRYDHEARSIGDLAPAPYSLSPGEGSKATYSKPQPKISLKYNITDQASIYGTYAEGFKSGGFNPFNSRKLALTSDPNTVVQDNFPKESTRDLELGFHTRWLNRKLSVDGALFYSQAKSAQVFEFFPGPSLQANASVNKADKKGVEFNSVYVPLPGLTFNLGFGYTYSTIAELQANPSLVGKRMPYSPLTQADLGAQYQVPLNKIIPISRDDISSLIRVDYQRLGSTWWDIYNTPGTMRDAVDLVNARLAFQSDKWTVSLWAKNLLNKQYISDDVVLNSLISVVYPAQPATYGIDVTWKF